MVEHSDANAIKMSSPTIRMITEFCSTPLYRNEKFLREKYEGEGISARQIAEVAGCSHDAINRALKKFGIVKVKQKSGPPIFGQKLKNGKRVPHVRELQVVERVFKLHQQGMNPSQIAEALNQNGQSRPARLMAWNRYAVQRILANYRKRFKKPEEGF